MLSCSWQHCAWGQGWILFMKSLRWQGKYSPKLMTLSLKSCKWSQCQSQRSCDLSLSHIVSNSLSQDKNTTTHRHTGRRTEQWHWTKPKTQFPATKPKTQLQAVLWVWSAPYRNEMAICVSLYRPETHYPCVSPENWPRYLRVLPQNCEMLPMYLSRGNHP